MARSDGQLYAELYDDTVHDWPGEIDFYRELLGEVGGPLLEVACGTGRVLLRLATEDIQATGFDRSLIMLDVARRNGANSPNVTLLEGDMRAFEIDGQFQLAIIPGHSFQFMLTPEDQEACLRCIHQHLAPNGVLVVHLDQPEIDWLGDLFRESGGVFKPESEVSHPETDNLIRISKAWSYQPSTQTASAITRQEEVDADGEILKRWESEPTSLHCVFRFEMEHLLARTGFITRTVYGDFFKQPHQDESSEMIWVARRD